MVPCLLRQRCNLAKRQATSAARWQASLLSCFYHHTILRSLLQSRLLEARTGAEDIGELEVPQKLGQYALASPSLNCSGAQESKHGRPAILDLHIACIPVQRLIKSAIC